jgi:hypothetical protein
MSNMLFSIVTAALSQDPDIVIAGRVADAIDLAPEIRRANADALIVQLESFGSTANFLPLLSIFPNLAIVVINSSCSCGFVHRLRPCSLRIPEISAGALQTVLRAQPGSDGQVLL